MQFDCGHLSVTGAKALFSPRRGLTRRLSIRSGTYSPSVSLAFDSSLYTREPEAYRSRQGVPRPRLPRQCAHCLAMTKDGQCAHCLAMTRDWQRAHYSRQEPAAAAQLVKKPRRVWRRKPTNKIKSFSVGACT